MGGAVTVFLIVLIMLVLYIVVKQFMRSGTEGSGNSFPNEHSSERQWQGNEASQPIFQETHMANNEYGQYHSPESDSMHQANAHAAHTDTVTDQSAAEHDNISYTDSSSFSDSYSDSSSSDSSSSSASSD